MICPRCHREQSDGTLECGQCGVIIAQYRPHPRTLSQASDEEDVAGWRGRWAFFRSWLRERMFEVEPEEIKAFTGVRALFLLLLAMWGVRLALLPIEGEALGGSILHLIHLPFHEAGHFVFSPFGRFLHVLGGTLGQLLVPLLVAGAFLGKQNPYGASVGIWWLGASFMDCAPYIYDARAGELMLIGGVTGKEMPDYHDWEVMLGRLGLMRYDHSIAQLFWLVGVLVMAASLAWGGYIVWKQSRPDLNENKGD